MNKYTGYDVDDEEYKFYDYSSGLPEVKTIRDWKVRTPQIQDGVFQEDARYEPAYGVG